MFSIIKRIGICFITTVTMKATVSLWDNILEDMVRKRTEYLRKKKDTEES